MPNMEPMKTFTVGADTWEIVDGAAREELVDARTGADGTEYESTGAAIRGAVEGITGDLEENYALQDGYYEMLTAGSADNLTGRGDGVGAEFIYRTSGGSADVADGVAKINSIHGNTLVWNQLITAMTKTATGGEPFTSGTRIVSGHKYLMKSKFDITEYVENQIRAGLYTHTDSETVLIAQLMAVNSGVQSLIFTSNYDAVSTGNTSGVSGNCWLWFSFFSNVGAVSDIQLFDLTRMFGAGNEPATVEEFEALYPASYYAYDAGSLLDVHMQGVRTVGFNQWDIEENSLYQGPLQGEVLGNNTNVSTHGYIAVFPNTIYEQRHDVVSAISGQYVKFYDANKTELENTQYTTYTEKGAFQFTTPDNARYVRFMWYGSSSLFVSDMQDTGLCLHLVWSGYRNGEYEEYWTQTREIDTAEYFPGGMKSAGSVYDELTATKAVKRVGVVDLGTLTWGKNNNYNGAIAYYVENFPCGTVANNNTIVLQTSDLTPTTANACYSATDGVKLLSVNTSKTLWLRNGDMGSAAEAKAALSGMMVYYELAEHVETEITPELNLTYKVSDFGTEEIVVADGAQTAPVCMQIVYGLNAVDTIRRLPVEYISHKSFMQFISAIESHFNVTITETYDSDNERYNYSIATNESGE